MTKIILVMIISYLFGSVPFSYIIPKLKGVDVRKIGSGNVGGTNVMRALGLKYGVLCIILDGLKGLLPAMIVGKVLGLDCSLLALLSAVLGHDYPIFMKFKGGKGVATTVGGIFGITPYLGWVFLAVWIPIVLISKIVSIASLIGLLTVAVLSLIFFGGTSIPILYFALAGISIYKHRENIQRLVRGDERKVDLLKMVKRREKNSQKEESNC